MAKTKETVIYCGLCQRVIPAEDIAAGRHTYSAWTGNRYCPQSDYKKCREIRAKLIKQKKIDPKKRLGRRKNKRQIDYEAVGRHKEKVKAKRKDKNGKGN